MTVSDDLLAEIVRVDRNVVPLLPKKDGITFLLVRKSIFEARKAIESKDPERQKFYLDVLKRCRIPTCGVCGVDHGACWRCGLLLGSIQHCPMPCRCGAWPPPLEAVPA